MCKEEDQTYFHWGDQWLMSGRWESVIVMLSQFLWSSMTWLFHQLVLLKRERILGWKYRAFTLKRQRSRISSWSKARLSDSIWNQSTNQLKVSVHIPDKQLTDTGPTTGLRLNWIEGYRPTTLLNCKLLPKPDFIEGQGFKLQENSWKRKKLNWLKTIVKVPGVVAINRVQVVELYSPERVNKVAK